MLTTVRALICIYVVDTHSHVVMNCLALPPSEEWRGEARAREGVDPGRRRVLLACGYKRGVRVLQFGRTRFTHRSCPTS